jgi:hypothetical protein
VNIKTTLKTSVAAAALFAIAVPASGPASAADDTLKSGSQGNTLTISGQVVRAIWYGDDGEHDGIFNNAAETAHSRVRWIATGTLNENVTAGGVIEMDIPLSNDGANSNFGSITGDKVSGDQPNWSIRQQYVWVAHKKFGKVYLGQTDAAANGNMQASLSGAGGTTTMNNVWVGSGIRFLDTTNAVKSFSAQSPGAVMSDMDFTSRADVLRYDTPSMMGLVVSASYEDTGTPEIGGRYKGKFGPVAVDARVGYANRNMSSTTVDSNLGGSIAVLHDSGVNAAFSYGTEKMQAVGRNTKKNLYGLIGYNAKIFGVGGTAFNVTYARTKNNTANDDEGTVWGAQATQAFSKIGASLSLVYRNYDFENSTTAQTNIDSIDVFGLQAAFAF